MSILSELMEDVQFAIKVAKITFYMPQSHSSVTEADKHLAIIVQIYCMYLQLLWFRSLIIAALV